ncbi:hypothetical protein HDU89_002238 [Geranomyces variabilis]|nr:hypothetical protein HDU89_002238 [Geranomyces variabilis]
MLHCCAKQRGIKLLNDLPATASRTETPSANRKRPAEDEAVPRPSKRIRMAQNEPPVVFACRVFRQLAEDGKISAAQARACRRVVTESAANDLLLASYEYEAGVPEPMCWRQLTALRRLIADLHAETVDQYRRTEAAGTSRKRPAENEAVAHPTKPIRMAANEPPVVFACRVFRQLAEDGKISAAQARACRRVVTESAANDLLLASYLYEAGVPDTDVLAVINRIAPPPRPLARRVAAFVKEEVKRQTLRSALYARVNEADVLAAINRVAPPPRPLARRVAEFVKEELKRQTLRSVCAYAFKAGVNAAAVVVLNRLTKQHIRALKVDHARGGHSAPALIAGPAQRSQHPCQSCEPEDDHPYVNSNQKRCIHSSYDNLNERVFTERDVPDVAAGAGLGADLVPMRRVL